MKYVCTICGYIYDEASEGTPFADLPSDWTCPICGAGKDAFEVRAAETAVPAATAEVSAGPAAKVSAAAAPAAASTPGAAKAPLQAAASAALIDDDLEELPPGVIADICSNLARGCEKQYHPEEQQLFTEIAQYFSAQAAAQHEEAVTASPEDSLAKLVAQLKEDLDANYPALKGAAVAAGDRGTQRICVWGEKVTRVLLSLAERYRREGEKMLSGTKIWVCSVCGFTYVGDKPPALCPVCKVPDWKFDEIDGRAA